MAQEVDAKVFSAMQTGLPYKSYKKTIMAKVSVTVLNPFSNEVSVILLEGDNNDPESILDVWSEKEDAFFKRMNRRALETGRIISYKRPAFVEEEQKIEQMSDDDIAALIKKPFMVMQSVLSKTDSEAFVYRILQAARVAEKSEKYVAAIETRLGEIQSGISEEE